MATLNIKNLPDDLYEDLRRAARREHRSITQQVVHLLREATHEQPPRSIRELKGLGKELWRDVDAAAHVERERASWD